MDFPLSVAMLMDVLEVTAPFKHFAKLRDFVNLKLPPGFPVKLGTLYVNRLTNETSINCVFTKHHLFLWDLLLY